MNKYTTVLLRPDYLQEDGNDTYTAYNEALDARHAVKLARLEAQKALKKDALVVRDPLDFALIMCFNGWPPIALYGFQE